MMGSSTTLKNPVLQACENGQKNNFSWNGGLSATLSIPLDGGLQARCKKAADAQIAIQEQTLANRRLDSEIARLKIVEN